MRKLIVSMNVTLDGFMAGPHDELDWHFQSWSDDMGMFISQELAKADTIILGRVTYLAMADYWPTRSTALSCAREDIAFAEMMNQYKKIVFSKTIHSTSWSNSEIVNGSIHEIIFRLKRCPGKDMIIYGSGKLVKSLMKANLVDEYMLWVHPVLLGKGRSFFLEVNADWNIELIERKSFESGVIALKYQVRSQIKKIEMEKKTFNSIDEYIASFPNNIQTILQQVRETIHDAAPNAVEAISYQIPTFKQNGNLVHFAAWKNHIGFYPTPSGTKEFEKELSKYKRSKGSVQFPLDEPMPLSLIKKIVKYRVKANK